MKNIHWDRNAINDLIHELRSFLCVGLDTDIEKLPKHLGKTPAAMLEFNRRIVDKTLPFTVAYKINTAFYEPLGPDGWHVIEESIQYIKSLNRFIILDAKRGDIGNTSTMYAKAAFEQLNADAVTVSPYMGSDSVKPFLAQNGKWTIVLALTSNEGAQDFQLKKLESGKFLFEEVLELTKSWGTNDNMMFVTGATKSEYFHTIRSILPHHFLLVPGVGAQGGNLEELLAYGATIEGDLLINASRSIIYASVDQDFDQAASTEAQYLQKIMSKFV